MFAIKTLEREREREMNLEDKRWFALLSCFFVGSVTGMQYAFSVYSDALKDRYDLKQSEVRVTTSESFSLSCP